MYFPKYPDFESLAKQGNVIPVCREIRMDLETPVSVFLKLRADSNQSCLLESVEGGEQLGRYSFLITNPSRALTVQNNRVIIRSHCETGPGKFTNIHEEPLGNRSPADALRDFLSPYRAVSIPGLPRFPGGAIGYLSYDAVRYFERLPATSIDQHSFPDAMFLLSDTLVIFDHVKHRALVVANAHLTSTPRIAYQEAMERIEQILQKLERSIPRQTESKIASTSSLCSKTCSEKYAEMVHRAQEHIKAGDIFQVNLSQRFVQETHADAFSIYRSLRNLNPSPYLYFFDFGELQFIGSSPETLVRLEDGIAQIDPIAGTRPRSLDSSTDQQLEKELKEDPKERAEHVMLVDLARNDLGRVCEYGSIQIPRFMTVERYSHVMHLVSRVCGRLNPEADAFDLLRATFPAGTVTGAPKVRAMEIIEVLEESRRGPYAGPVGYFGFPVEREEGRPKVLNMDLCIAIRTIVKRGSQAFIQAGAGIVADSDAGREYQECSNKAQVLAEAIRFATA